MLEGRVEQLMNEKERANYDRNMLMKAVMNAEDNGNKLKDEAQDESAESVSIPSITPKAASRDLDDNASQAGDNVSQAGDNTSQAELDGMSANVSLHDSLTEDDTNSNAAADPANPRIRRPS